MCVCVREENGNEFTSNRTNEKRDVTVWPRGYASTAQSLATLATLATAITHCVVCVVCCVESRHHHHHRECNGAVVAAVAVAYE